MVRDRGGEGGTIKEAKPAAPTTTISITTKATAEAGRAALRDAIVSTWMENPYSSILENACSSRF